MLEIEEEIHDDDFDAQPTIGFDVELAFERLGSMFKHGNFELVGHGKVTNDDCGRLYGFKGCLNVHAHGQPSAEGVRHVGKALIKPIYHWCHNPRCPICYKSGWAVREAHNIRDRLNESKKRFGAIEHIIVSPPKSAYHLTLKEAKREVTKMCIARRVIGGNIIFHGFRYHDKTQSWYWSPHFHILGHILGGYSQCRKCSYWSTNRHCKPNCGGFINNYMKEWRKHGWIFKVKEKRKTVVGTAWYQLNHSTVDVTKKRFHVSTWFGVCSYRKLKVTKEKRKMICKLCGLELQPIKFIGKGSYVIPVKGDKDWKIEYIRDMYDSEGKPLWKIKGDTSTADEGGYYGEVARDINALREGSGREAAYQRAWEEYEKSHQ